MIPSQSIGGLSGTPSVDPGAGSPVVCYTIGACVFSELSYLLVTKHEWTQQPDCSFTESRILESWPFDSRTATTFRYAFDADNWAEYNGITGRWTWLAEASEIVGNGICLGTAGPSVSVETCSSATFFASYGGVQEIVIEWVVMRNDCIPSIAV